MEKNSFLDLSKEVKLAIFYSISSELAGKDKEIKTFILSFFLNIHKFSIENMLNNTSISKIISNLVFMKNSTIDKDYLKNEILEACKIKKKINYSNPNETCLVMAKKFLDIEISRSKKNKQTSQFHLYRQNLLEDRNAQRRLFFDFISICIKELEKNNLLKHRYSNYFMKKIKI